MKTFIFKFCDFEIQRGDKSCIPNNVKSEGEGNRKGFRVTVTGVQFSWKAIFVILDRSVDHLTFEGEGEEGVEGLRK